MSFSSKRSKCWHSDEEIRTVTKYEISNWQKLNTTSDWEEFWTGIEVWVALTQPIMKAQSIHYNLARKISWTKQWQNDTWGPFLSHFVEAVSQNKRLKIENGRFYRQGLHLYAAKKSVSVKKNYGHFARHSDGFSPSEFMTEELAESWGN